MQMCENWTNYYKNYRFSMPSVINFFKLKCTKTQSNRWVDEWVSVVAIKHSQYKQKQVTAETATSFAVDVVVFLLLLFCVALTCIAYCVDCLHWKSYANLRIDMPLVLREILNQIIFNTTKPNMSKHASTDRPTNQPSNQ